MPELVTAIYYTGALLIGDNFINDYYVHMGFQSPITYEYLKEITFENGILVKTRDLSREAKERRQMQKSVGKDYGHLSQWIEDQFDLSYGKRW